MGSSLEQKIVCKIFNPYGRGSWYVMNQDPDDPDYLWGIVDFNSVEMGSFLRSDLERVYNVKMQGRIVPVRMERDLHYKQEIAGELWSRLVQNKT